MYWTHGISMSGISISLPALLQVLPKYTHINGSLVQIECFFWTRRSLKEPYQTMCWLRPDYTWRGVWNWNMKHQNPHVKIHLYRSLLAHTIWLPPCTLYTVCTIFVCTWDTLLCEHNIIIIKAIFLVSHPAGLSLSMRRAVIYLIFLILLWVLLICCELYVA